MVAAKCRDCGHAGNIADKRAVQDQITGRIDWLCPSCGSRVEIEVVDGLTQAIIETAGRDFDQFTKD